MVEIAAFSTADSSILWTWAGPDRQYPAQWFHPGGRASRVETRRRYQIDEATGATLSSSVNDFSTPTTEGSYMGVDIHGNGISIGDPKTVTSAPTLWTYGSDGTATQLTMQMPSGVPWESANTPVRGWIYGLTNSGHAVQLYATTTSGAFRLVDYTDNTAFNFTADAECRRPAPIYDTIQGHWKQMIDCNDDFYAIRMNYLSLDGTLITAWKDGTTRQNRYGVAPNFAISTDGFIWLASPIGGGLTGFGRFRPEKTGTELSYSGQFLTDSSSPGDPRLFATSEGRVVTYSEKYLYGFAPQTTKDPWFDLLFGWRPGTLAKAALPGVVNADGDFTVVEKIPGTDDAMVIAAVRLSYDGSTIVRRSLVARINCISGAIVHSKLYLTLTFPTGGGDGRPGCRPGIWDNKLILSLWSPSMYDPSGDNGWVEA